VPQTTTTTTTTITTITTTTTTTTTTLITILAIFIHIKLLFVSNVFQDITLTSIHTNALCVLNMFQIVLNVVLVQIAKTHLEQLYK
jgi:hypothetical protein